MSVLIKNGRIITAEKDFFADIFIEKEKIMNKKKQKKKEKKNVSIPANYRKK